MIFHVRPTDILLIVDYLPERCWPVPALVQIEIVRVQIAVAMELVLAQVRTQEQFSLLVAV
ncbi:MAG TPA: hypothetical protein VMW42_04670 [Desulfatiglandales bacterium]|nr:hypothetical protein [Desulfatiglandales bacterium]